MKTPEHHSELKRPYCSTQIKNNSMAPQLRGLPLRSDTAREENWNCTNTSRIEDPSGCADQWLQQTAFKHPCFAWS